MKRLRYLSIGRTEPALEEMRRYELRVGDHDAIVYQYVRGYWLTRYIEDTRPELLKGLLSQLHHHNDLESKIATAYGKKHEEELWCEIDRVLVSHFKQKGGAA